MCERTSHTRRRVLVSTGGFVSMGLAGCLGTRETETSPGDTRPAGGGSGDGDRAERSGGDRRGRNSGGAERNGTDRNGGNRADENPERDGQENRQRPDDNTGQDGGSAGAAQLEITVKSDEFVPRIDRLQVGGTVRFVCEGGSHTATLYHPDNGGKPQRAPPDATAWDSGLLSSGDTFEVTLNEPGVYDYFCKPHEGVGMVGSIVVGDNADPNQPGLSEPRGLPVGAADQLGELNAEARRLLGIGNGGNGGNGNEGTGGNGNDGNEENGNGGNDNGGTDENGGNDGGNAGQANLEVTIVSNRFSPQIDQIQPGGTVRFVCQDGSHTATLYHPDNGGSLPRRAPSGAASFASGFLEEGDTFEVTLDEPGVYDYFCRPHQDDGMVGSIVVGDNADPNQAGLSNPSGVPAAGAAGTLRRLNDQARNILNGNGGGGGGGGNDGGGVTPPIERQERDGEIFIGVEGTKAPGNEVTIIATLDGEPVADAPVLVDHRTVGRTNEAGKFDMTMGQRFRVTVRANGVRGRYRLRFVD